MRSLLSWLLALFAIIIIILQGAVGEDAIGPLYHTTPFVDERVQGPQLIPGKILLAYYDNGGPEVAYHSYDNKNHGSCDLNPCDGTYKNTFRKDDGASTSYTKPANGGWPGDRFYGNGSHVPADQMYWGWNALGNWVRVSVLVKEAGDYTTSLFGTCNSGGTVNISVAYNVWENDKTAQAHIPSTTFYHNWSVANDIATFFLQEGPAVLTVNITGPAVLTVNITGIDDFQEGAQYGNIMWLDFGEKL